MHFEIFQSKKNGKWYWRLRAANDLIVADGGQGYTRSYSALLGAHRATITASKAVVKPFRYVGH